MNLRRSPLLVLAALLHAPAAAPGSQEPGAATARLVADLHAFVPRVMEENGTPGLNLALAIGGRIVMEEGYGLADVATGRPMTPATVTRAGSLSKLYTATAVLQLVEQDVLALRDPLDEHVSDFAIENPLGDRAVTAYDLLTHTSGLSVNGGGASLGPPLPLVEHLRRGYAEGFFPTYGGRTQPRWSARVGERYQYSNFGFATLGHLAAATNPEGLGFAELVDRRIFAPLGATSSRFAAAQDGAGLPAELAARLSTGYARLGDVHVPTPEVFIGDWPAGTLVTTPGDHLRFLVALRAGGSLDGARLLDPRTVAEMLRPQITTSGGSAIGLGVQIHHTGRRTHRWGHRGGHMYGWRTDGRVYPHEDVDVALVVATNQWDLAREANPSWRHDADWIADFVVAQRTLRADGLAYEREPRTWGWKTAYVAGLVAAESLVGRLGIEGPLDDELVEALMQGARPASTPWDPEGFRTGLVDMAALETTPRGIQVFLRSADLRVSPAEIPLLCRTLGMERLPLTWQGAW